MGAYGILGRLDAPKAFLSWASAFVILSAAAEIWAADSGYVVLTLEPKVPSSTNNKGSHYQRIGSSPAPKTVVKPIPPRIQTISPRIVIRAVANHPPSKNSVGSVIRQVANQSAQRTSLPIDLATALRLANAANPTIAMAQERVREAYARLREAEILLLPTLQTGPAYYRHDGQIQNARGEIFAVSKSNLFEGGGAFLHVGLSDALFAPLVARRLVQAQTAAAQTVVEETQLDVALTYLELLRGQGALAINADILKRTEDKARSARIAQEEGKSKTCADLNRALTELNMRREERNEIEAQAAAVSARLAQLLLLEPTLNLKPVEPAIVPIRLIAESNTPLDELVATGLLNRSELSESRSLVAAALARWRQARLSPLMPRLEAGYVTGTFGGGKGEEINSFAGRGDGIAMALWELPGLGVGYLARTRVQRSIYNQANLHVLEVQARVAAEVTAAAKLAQARRGALESGQQAVKQAEEMWKKLKAASFGMAGAGGRFDPLEPLLAVQALAAARSQYLNQVIEYNKAQFRLYRAMGQPPLAALPGAKSLPVAIPVTPKG